MTNDADERARQAAHVLLDMLTAWDSTPVGEDADRTVALAASRLAEVDAVRVFYDDETDTRTVNIAPLLNAAMNLMTVLSAEVMRHRPGVDGAGLVSALRDAVDQGFYGPTE